MYSAEPAEKASRLRMLTKDVFDALAASEPTAAAEQMFGPLLKAFLCIFSRQAPACLICGQNKLFRYRTTACDTPAGRANSFVHRSQG